MTPNQNPEQAARDRIDMLLEQSGWVVQDKKAINFNAGHGIAVREYLTDVGPADYVLFVNKTAVGVVEAKKEEAGMSLRARLAAMPALNPQNLPAADLGLRDCQETAVVNLENSFSANRPRALIQMATGSGKTFTAITEIYRLLKHAKAKRILFLVDTKNLGEQAEQEFMAFTPSDDNRTYGFFKKQRRQRLQPRKSRRRWRECRQRSLYD